jgi:ApaG protein
LRCRRGSSIVAPVPTEQMEGSVITTDGVRVAVKTAYLEHQSAPQAGRFVFAYTIRITNVGTRTVQLRTRHWIITEASGEVREVRGEGVVGEQPTLSPGEAFEYTSGCVLKSQWGTMHGSYQMEREGGQRFDAQIAPFLLAAPSMTAARVLN